MFCIQNRRLMEFLLVYPNLSFMKINPSVPRPNAVCGKPVLEVINVNTDSNADPNDNVDLDPNATITARINIPIGPNTMVENETTADEANAYGCQY